MLRFYASSSTTDQQLRRFQLSYPPPRLRALNEKPSVSRPAYADGCFKIFAKACSRAASAGLVAIAAFFSKDGAMLLNFATLLLLMCEFSASRIPARRAAIRSAGKACDLSN